MATQFEMSKSDQTKIKRLYHAYRHTEDIDQKGLFFSPTCMQICRLVPAYAATSRDGIVRYLKDAQEGKVPAKTSSPSNRKSGESSRSDPKIDAAGKAEKHRSEERRQSQERQHSKGDAKNQKETEKTASKGAGHRKRGGVYTIRPLHISEFEFSTNTITASVGYKPTDLKAKAEKEGWVGMRVDLWDESDPRAGLLVKVQYWWRWEKTKTNEKVEGDVDGYGWRQCLHDIMYLGPKDGTQGEEGLEVLE